MFELSIARKYLIPKRKALSVSLISLMSIVVISLVVWLVLVFLSVTDGIEKGWLAKLTSLNGPLRITPAKEYFASYYHQIDQYATASDYTVKSLGQKALAAGSDPYDASRDIELPDRFPKPHLDGSGQLVDPVKRAFGALESLNLAYQDYEVTGAMVRLQMLRPTSQSYLTQVAYVATLLDRNPNLKSLMLPHSASDISNAAFLASMGGHIEVGDQVYLPKNFQESGILVGDSGYLTYAAQGASSVQEQRIPIRVAGFYDPGIMAIGHKCILAPSHLVHVLKQSNQSFQIDPTFSGGIQIWIDDISKAREVKQQIINAFQEAGIGEYFQVASFHDYDFAKDLLQQFQSDKTLFTLIGIIILGVACCNIISLLILLVHDKKKEIGILSAMGASKTSIAMIFATCGALMGVLSSLIGVALALLTLRNIDAIAHFLSFVQGHEMFNAMFYGSSLPNQLSSDAVTFILIATPLLSLLAGLAPAIKACRLRPSEILKVEV